MSSEEGTVLTHRSCMRFAEGNVRTLTISRHWKISSLRCTGSVRSVGITAGASTPNQIIEEVHTNVRIKF